MQMIFLSIQINKIKRAFLKDEYSDNFVNNYLQKFIDNSFLDRASQLCLIIVKTRNMFYCILLFNYFVGI